MVSVKTQLSIFLCEQSIHFTSQVSAFISFSEALSQSADHIGHISDKGLCFSSGMSLYIFRCYP